METILTDLLFNFETTQYMYKNYFDANLVKIYSVVIEILSISYFVQLFVIDDGGHLGMPNCKTRGPKGPEPLT